MKKVLLTSAVVLFGSVALASAMPQYIITDCGTVRQIPDNASEDDACFYVDYYSNTDCGTSYEV